MNIKSLITKIKKNKILQIFLFFLCFLIIVALIFLPYILKFGGSGFSNSTTVWAEYGSYISGATSFLNLLVFIVLTIYVAQLGNSNNKKQLENQKKILLAQFRYSELIIIKEKINNEYKLSDFSDLKKYSLSLIKLTWNMDDYLAEKVALFPSLMEPDNLQIRRNIIDEVNIFLDDISSYDFVIEMPQGKINKFSFSKAKIENDMFILFNNLLQDILKELETK